MSQCIDGGKAQVIGIFYRVKFNGLRFVKLCYQMHELAFFFTGGSHGIISGKIAHEADEDAYGRSYENQDNYVDLFQDTFGLLVRLGYRFYPPKLQRRWVETQR